MVDYIREAGIKASSVFRRKMDGPPESRLGVGETLVDAVRSDISKQAIIDFIKRQSEIYNKHSANAIQEDMVLACHEFGVDPRDFCEVDDDGGIDDPDFYAELVSQVAYREAIKSVTFEP